MGRHRLKGVCDFEATFVYMVEKPGLSRYNLYQKRTKLNKNQSTTKQSPYDLVEIKCKSVLQILRLSYIHLDEEMLLKYRFADVGLALLKRVFNLTYLKKYYSEYR